MFQDEIFPIQTWTHLNKQLLKIYYVLLSIVNRRSFRPYKEVSFVTYKFILN